MISAMLFSCEHLSICFFFVCFSICYMLLSVAPQTLHLCVWSSCLERRNFAKAMCMLTSPVVALSGDECENRLPTRCSMSIRRLSMAWIAWITEELGPLRTIYMSTTLEFVHIWYKQHDLVQLHIWIVFIAVVLTLLFPVITSSSLSLHSASISRNDSRR